MNNLEHFIRLNREQFDSEDPPEGHCERFSIRLEELHRGAGRNRNVRLWLKVAAGFLIFITAGLAILELTTGGLTRAKEGRFASDALPSDIREAILYYQQRTDQRLREIDQLALNCPDASQSGKLRREELALLNQNLDDLLVACRENPGNSRVQAALVQNYQAQESLLDSYLLAATFENCKTKK